MSAQDDAEPDDRAEDVVPLLESEVELRRRGSSVSRLTRSLCAISAVAVLCFVLLWHRPYPVVFELATPLHSGHVLTELAVRVLSRSIAQSTVVLCGRHASRRMLMARATSEGHHVLQGASAEDCSRTLGGHNNGWVLLLFYDARDDAGAKRVSQCFEPCPDGHHTPLHTSYR